MANTRPFKVSELTFLIQRKLESEPAFRNAQVQGEISNLRPPNTSGHVYFTLKDNNAQISCAMFKSVAMKYLGDLPKHGEEVTVVGDISLYPPQGSYQLIVKSLEKGGMEGLLHRRFLELKAKLELEGLFDPQLKRKLPKIPRRIGVVTSPTGAVIRDICNTLRRRFPHVEVIVVPALVQGAQGASSIVAALACLNQLKDIDLVILARGGGSLEDLWCFNEEIVARAIRASKAPVVSGVGHETDVTIADFVADLRAATPTAAAELAVPLASEIRNFIDQGAMQMKRSLQFFIDTRRQLLDDTEFKLQTRNNNAFDVRRQLLREAETQLEHALWTTIQRAHHELNMAESKLHSLDLRQVLQRGFTITEKDGKTLRSIAELAPGDLVTTHFYQGTAHTRVESLETHE